MRAYARLNRQGDTVICAASGCGQPLGLVVIDMGKRLLWLPPDFRPRHGSERTWERSTRATRQAGQGRPASSWRTDPAGGYPDEARLPTGSVPFLPADITCPARRCGLKQELAGARLDVANRGRALPDSQGIAPPPGGVRRLYGADEIAHYGRYLLSAGLDRRRAQR
jgi:hypothetical protein